MPLKTKSENPAEMTLGQKVDRLGELESRLAPWKPLIKEATDLRAEIGQSFAGPAEAHTEVRGERFFSTIGARKYQTKIRSMRAVLKAVGQRIFLAHCSYTLETLKGDAPGQYDSLVETERTGTRDVKTFAIVQGAKAA